jgi:glutathione S-transferase
MSELLLTIGNKNYSSWSLRPWILMKHLGLKFDERLLPLDTPEFARDIPAISPTKRVPILAHGSLLIWD